MLAYLVRTVDTLTLSPKQTCSSWTAALVVLRLQRRCWLEL